MKNFVVLIHFLFCSYIAVSQKYSPELEKSYSKKELKSMSTEELKLLNYALENAVYITSIPSKTDIDLKTIKVPLTLIKFTDAGLKIENQNQYFRIEGTDKMMVVKSNYVLKNEIENKKIN